MQITEQNSPQFKGLFQGLIIKGQSSHALPRNPMPSCPYADRLMTRIVYKALKSDKYQSRLNTSFKEIDGVKTLVFEMDPKTIKRLIPLKIKLLPKESSDLPNPVFWGILGNKKISKIRYMLSQQDSEKLVSYFNEPKTVTEKITRSVEDSSIVKKVRKLKQTLLDNSSDSQNQKWLNEFFSTSNI